MDREDAEPLDVAATARAAGTSAARCSRTSRAPYDGGGEGSRDR
jgi:hypothetical protein